MQLALESSYWSNVMTVLPVSVLRRRRVDRVVVVRVVRRRRGQVAVVVAVVAPLAPDGVLARGAALVVPHLLVVPPDLIGEMNSLQ